MLNLFIFNAANWVISMSTKIRFMAWNKLIQRDDALEILS